MGGIRHVRMKTKASKVISMHSRRIIDVLINRRRLYHFIGPQRVVTKIVNIAKKHARQRQSAPTIIPIDL